MRHIEKNDDEATVILESDLMAVNAKDFRDDMSSLIGQGTRKIAFDFSNVAEMDAMAIGSLVATHNHLKDRGGAMQLTNVNNELMKMFKILRLNEHFAIIATQS